jgi:hypothetical protein
MKVQEPADLLTPGGFSFFAVKNLERNSRSWLMEFVSWPAVRAPCNRHLEFGVTLLETLEGNCKITFFDAPLNAKQNRHPARTGRFFFGTPKEIFRHTERDRFI